MNILTLLLFLASLVGIDAQGCTQESALNAIRNRLNVPEGETFGVVFKERNPSCLVTDNEYGLYKQISLSVKYVVSQNDSTVRETRHTFFCIFGLWLRLSDDELTPHFNGSRSDCSDCSNPTVNEHHCAR